MINFYNLIYMMKLTFQKVSLNRIFQQIFAKKIHADNRIIEFGAFKDSKKNFTNFINIQNRKDIIYADKQNLVEERSYKEDLETKLTFEDASFDNVIIFNVLEHVFDMNNAIKEIYRCLDTNGKIVGSTPFIHRIHNAPGDYNRYSEQFYEKILKKNNFNNISVEVYGFGPCTACYVIIFDYTKFIPFLNNFILVTCIFFDSILNTFVKTSLKKIYPVTICFSARK